MPSFTLSQACETHRAPLQWSTRNARSRSGCSSRATTSGFRTSAPTSRCRTDTYVRALYVACLPSGLDEADLSDSTRSTRAPTPATGLGLYDVLLGHSETRG
jgi:hypothetical protein